MNVIQVCPRFSPYNGGIETHVREVSQRLVRSGFNVKIYTTDPSRKLPKRQIIDGVEISRFDSYTPRQIYFLAPRLYSALKKTTDADIIHAHGYPNFPALAAAVTKDKNGKPLVFTSHYGGYGLRTLGTSIWQQFAKRCYDFSIGQYILSKADAIVVVGRFEGKLLRQKFGLDERKINYIPNGLNVKRFEDSAMNRARVDRSVKSILYVGRLEKYKGVHYLIKSFAKIKAYMPNSQLLIVGSGLYKEKLIYLASSLGVQDSVKFLEGISQEYLTQLYFSSDVFVTLSQYESQSISLMEAMASGIPVIATRVRGIRDLIQHNMTGLLLNYPPDENALAEYIMYLLNNPHFSVKIGLGGRNMIFHEFSWDRTVRDLIKLYDLFS